jgi:ketosteroid isomerase-like protein
MNTNRKIGAVMLAMLVLVLTAGCMKLDMNLEVSSQDTVSGDVTFAISKSLAEMGQENGGEAGVPATDNLFGGEVNAEVTPFDDGKFVGSTYKLDAVPLENFATSNDSSQLSIVREGDYLVVSGLLDMTGGDPDSIKEAMENPFTSALFEGTSIRVAITLPGTIEETTGVVEGNTVVWEGTMGDSLDISAKAKAPLPGSIDWVLIGVIAVLLVAVAAIVLIGRGRAKAKKESAKDSGVQDSQAEQAQTNSNI